MLFETERLVLREFSPADAPALLELNSDPEVLRYTGNYPFKNLEEVHAFIRDYDQYRLYGYGRWSVLWKETGEHIGWCGLKYRTDRKETDLGYRFRKKWWGKGIATEAAKASLQVGFESCGLERIIGNAMKENAASIRVLEKIGMTFFRELLIDGHEAVSYRISREDFLSLH